MIKIENTEVMGWEAAIRGMRNPMNSWDKSDSFLCREVEDGTCPEDCSFRGKCPVYGTEDFFVLGDNDYALMKNLRNAGTDHRKFMRMITVYVDITAPLYWWKEFDTYKVGTIANSCSTMHKIHKKKFTLEDFSCEHLLGVYDEDGKVNDLLLDVSPDCDRTVSFSPSGHMLNTVKMLNICRDKYLKTKDKKYWWQMIQLLPTSYNQRRTVMLNYEVLANIYKSRNNHKLDEWRALCNWIKTLPYSELITRKDNNYENM